VIETLLKIAINCFSNTKLKLTDANCVYGISEAASAAYGHLISEHVRAQIGCLAILLAAL